MEMSKTTFRRLLILVLTAILFYLGLQNISSIWAFIGRVIGLLTPIVMGLVTAFILNVPMNAIERHLFVRPFFLPKEKHYPVSPLRSKLKRPISLILSLCILLMILSILLFVVLPTLVQTISDLFNGIPTFLNRTKEWVSKTFDNEELNNMMTQLQDNWSNVITKLIQLLQHGVGPLLKNTLVATTSVFSVLGQFLVGLVLAIYILISKETLRRQLFKLMHAILSRNAIATLLPVLSLTNRTFSSYISGQFLEACILGTLTFLGMTILGMPFAPMITALVIIMAMIPIVGSFLSAAIGFILILTQSSTKALIFVIFFIILQQIEGNFIYPHVVGKSVKLPGLWVLFAIAIGGSVGGIGGVLIAIPTFSVIYTLIRQWVNSRLQLSYSARSSLWADRSNRILERMTGEDAKPQSRSAAMMARIMRKSRQPIGSSGEKADAGDAKNDKTSHKNENN